MPLANIEWHWPIIAAALREWDQWSKPSAAGVVATVKIETASTFEPVEEAFWTSDAWRRANLRYYPFHGRGYTQLTWETSYRSYGHLIGVGDDLVNNPALAMDPHIAANVMAAYWQSRGIRAMCERGDWTAARRAVQGGSAGLQEFIAIASALAW